ncbi:MAG TPA: hypothetical protein VJ735_20115 [Actinomycetes bacterium]|nr:hypothetical protein [Actinomycetes bacterium]
MGNALRGEVDFEAEGQRYTLRLGCNELAQLMDMWGIAPENGFDMVERLKRLRSPHILRDVVFQGLRKHQPTITLDAAGDVITVLGYDEMGDLIARALNRGMPPPPEPGEGGAAPEEPEDPKGAGTSTGS